MIMKNKYFKLSNKKLLFVFLFMIFCFIFILNYYTPIIADDYSYSFGINGERIHFISDIIIKQYDHYFHWGGRTIAHSLGQLFLMFPKIVFSIANSIIYTLLMYLAYANIADEKNKHPFVVLLIHFGLFFTLPEFGQNCLWLIGSCNYLWTSTIVLLFLLPFSRKKLDKKNSNTKMIGLFLLGILAGWTNENTGAALIVITSLLVLLSCYKEKNLKKTFNNNKWLISGLIGCVTGFLLMILAPGNYVRANAFKDESSFLIKILKRIAEATVNGVSILWPLIISLVIIISLYYYYKKKISNKSIIFLIGSLVAIYSMVLSPTFPGRAWFGVILFFLIGLLILLNEIFDYKRIIKIIIISTTLLITIYSIPIYYSLVKEIVDLNHIWDYRINVIENLKVNDKYDVEVLCYYPTNKKSPNYGLADISKDDKGWPNQDIARYYGIEKIKCVDIEN